MDLYQSLREARLISALAIKVGLHRNSIRNHLALARPSRKSEQIRSFAEQMLSEYGQQKEAKKQALLGKARAYIKRANLL
jgi:hypothetical protein